jgi:hypothetical protein
MRGCSRSVVKSVVTTIPMKRACTIALLLVWCLVMGERPAVAYVDPNSGSMLLQLVLAGTAGLGLIVRLTWRGLLSRIGLRRRDGPRDDHANG